MQLLAPASEYVPSGQIVGLATAALQKDPALQSTQAESPPPENVPGAQAVVTPDLQKLPDGQAMQEAADPVDKVEVFPSAQAVGVDAPCGQ